MPNGRARSPSTSRPWRLPEASTPGCGSCGRRRGSAARHAIAASPRKGTACCVRSSRPSPRASRCRTWSTPANCWRAKRPAARLEWSERWAGRWRSSALRGAMYAAPREHRPRPPGGQQYGASRTPTGPHRAPRARLRDTGARSARPPRHLPRRGYRTARRPPPRDGQLLTALEGCGRAARRGLHGDRARSPGPRRLGQARGRLLARGSCRRDTGPPRRPPRRPRERGRPLARGRSGDAVLLSVPGALRATDTGFKRGTRARGEPADPAGSAVGRLRRGVGVLLHAIARTLRSLEEPAARRAFLLTLRSVIGIAG